MDNENGYKPVTSESTAATDGDWTWRQFCGLESYHMLPLASAFLVRICIVLRCLWGHPLFLEQVRDLSVYCITAAGCGAALVVVALNVVVFNSPTLRAMRRDLPDRGTGAGLHLFMQIVAPVARPVALAPAIYAAYWCLRVVLFPDVPMHKHIWDDMPHWMVAMHVVGGGGSLLTIGYLMIVFLFVPWTVSRAAIDSIIDNIERAGADLDWSRLHVEVHKLDQQLEDMWSVKEVGSQWLLVIIIALLAALYGTQQLLIQQRGFATFFFFAGSLTTAALLYALSTISTRCCASTASPNGPRSILGSARRFLTRDVGGGKFMVEAMSEEQRSAHHRFVTFLASIGMGAQLCGVLVTQSWVLNTMANLGILLPLIYKGLRVSSSHEVVHMASH